MARSRVIQLGEYLISASLLFKMSLLAVFCVALPSFSMPREKMGVVTGQVISHMGAVTRDFYRTVKTVKEIQGR